MTTYHHTQNYQTARSALRTFKLNAPTVPLQPWLLACAGMMVLALFVAYVMVVQQSVVRGEQLQQARNQQQTTQVAQRDTR